MPEASLGMHPLMLEGWLTQPQPPRGHLARTRVTDSAAEITGPGPVGQLAGEAAAPEEAQEEGECQFLAFVPVGFRFSHL